MGFPCHPLEIVDRMRTRVGVALSRDAIRAVAVRRNRIVWAAEATVERGAPLEAAISSLLTKAPLPRFPRPILNAAVGPHASQVRLVAGLPEAPGTAAAGAIIREHTASFFLKDGVPLITTNVQPTTKTEAFAAAIDGPYVDAVLRVCRARHLQLGFIAPSAVCLPRAFEDRSFVWVDDNFVVDVSHIDGSLETIRTRPLSAAGSVESTSFRLAPPLSALGNNASRFADAYGVAATEAVPTLALDSVTAGFWSWESTRRRLTPPAVLFAAGVMAIALSPLSAVWAGQRAQVRLSRIRDDQVQTVVSTLDMLDRTTAIIGEVHGFASKRRDITNLLGALAAGLPAGTTVVSLELTDSLCQLGALSPNSADVLSAVRQIPGARSVELLGPVQHETMAGREIQRVTVRWSEDAQ